MRGRDARLVPQGLIQIRLKSVEILLVFHGFGLHSQIVTFSGQEFCFKHLLNTPGRSGTR